MQALCNNVYSLGKQIVTSGWGPIVREGYYNASDCLNPKEVLSGLDLSEELE